MTIAETVVATVAAMVAMTTAETVGKTLAAMKAFQQQLLVASRGYCVVYL